MGLSGEGKPAYPPTLEDVRTEFLAARPGYTFKQVGAERMFAPVETDGSVSSNGLGRRSVDWNKFVWDKMREMTKEAVEFDPLSAEGDRAVMLMAKPAMRSDDPFRDLWILEYAYSTFCRHPLITPEARAEREKWRADPSSYRRMKLLERLRPKTEANMEPVCCDGRISHYTSRCPQAAYLDIHWRRPTPHSSSQDGCHAAHMARVTKISALATRESLTQQEAEAVLAHLQPTGGFQKDTLLALQVINRYARANGIQNADAETVLREYL